MAIHSQPKNPAPRVFIEVPVTPESAPAPAPAEPETTKPKPPAEATASAPVVRDPSPADARTYRVRTIWSLLALSLLPGVLARAAPELWAGIPAAWHWAAYACSGMLLVAATILIVRPVDARGP
jgi:hypothetical protein